MTTTTHPYRGFRYPAEVIQHAVWLYHCFSLSLRDVETILLKSYTAAKRTILPHVEHRQSKYLNNCIEVSHQPTRRQNGRCSGSSQTAMRSASSPSMPTSITTSSSAATASLPPSTVPLAPPHSRFGER